MSLRLFGYLSLLAALSGCSAVSLRSVSSVAPSPKSTEEMSRQLKATIHDSILKIDPHYRNPAQSQETGGETVFTGNIDWHSAVHAHWALLSMARLTGDRAERDFILNRLQPEALDQERMFLHDNPDFEMPYGRVWLLQLLAEMEKHPEVRNDDVWITSVRALRKDTEADVLDWLEHTRFPDARNKPRYYSKTQKFRGDHYSWLFAHLFLVLSSPSDPKVMSRLRTLEREKIHPRRAELMKEPHAGFDFLEVPAMMSLLDLLTGKKIASSYACDRAELPVNDKEHAHRAGAYIMDSWPCALAGSRGDKASREIFHHHRDALMAHPELWRDNFQDLGHWVPQFIWMGMWIDAGRP